MVHVDVDVIRLDASMFVNGNEVEWRAFAPTSRSQSQSMIQCIQPLKCHSTWCQSINEQIISTRCYSDTQILSDVRRG
jgi:hypothetical protein